MTDLVIGRDENSIATFAIDMPDSAINFATVLTASTEKTIIIPADVTVALFAFSPGQNVWVSESLNPLSLPTSSFVSYEGVLNPVGRFVTSGNTLRFISPTTPYVNVTFYRR